MRTRLLAVVVLVAGLAGCGDATPADGGGADPGGDPLPDACGLVTKAEIEAAVEGTVAEGVASVPPPNHYAFGAGNQCGFVPDDGMVSVTYVAVFRATDEGWSAYVSEETTAFGSEPLTGVGDEAIIDVAHVGVRAGGFVVTMHFGMYHPQGPGQRERMVALAQTAAGRLP